MKRWGEGEPEIGQDCAADEEWSRSRETGTGREVKGWEKMWGFWSGADGVREAECEMLSEMLHPGRKKKKKKTAVFLIFDITDKLLWHAWIAFNVHGLNKQICSSATSMTLLLFFSSLWTKHKRISSPSYVVIPNLMGVCVSIPMANTIKHICLE